MEIERASKVKIIASREYLASIGIDEQGIDSIMDYSYGVHNGMTRIVNGVKEYHIVAGDGVQCYLPRDCIKC